MSRSQNELARRFLALHRESPGFIMPNAWDAGSAIVLAAEGFKAIATTSAGIAFSLGRQDYQVSEARFAVGRAEMLSRMGEIAASVDIPVNGDLEAGYGDRPEDVAGTIRLAVAAGLAGGNIEDRMPLQPRLYDEALAVERIRAARQAITASGRAFVLTARTDPFLVGSKDALQIAIRRGRLFREAGADCVYPPGVTDLETIRTFAQEVGGPVNIVAGLGTAAGNAHAMLAAGAQRVSLGGSLARAALGLVRRSARELRDSGSLGFAEGQIAQADLNALFGQARSGDAAGLN